MTNNLMKVRKSHLRVSHLRMLAVFDKSSHVTFLKCMTNKRSLSYILRI